MARPITLLIAAGILLLPCTLPADDPGALALSVRTAPVVIEPLPASRRERRLPDLEIEASIEARCDDGEIVSLLLSTADTRRQLEPPVDGTTVTTTLRVSARQLPPLVVRDFCETDGKVEAPMRVKRDFVAVHASLRCAVGDAETMTTATSMLDLTLECRLPETATGQEPSPSASRRKSSVTTQERSVSSAS